MHWCVCATFLFCCLQNNSVYWWNCCLVVQAILYYIIGNHWQMSLTNCSTLRGLSKLCYSSFWSSWLLGDVVITLWEISYYSVVLMWISVSDNDAEGLVMHAARSLSSFSFSFTTACKYYVLFRIHSKKNIQTFIKVPFKLLLVDECCVI